MTTPTASAASVTPGTARVLGGVEAGGTKVVCAIGSGPRDLRDRVAFPTTDPQTTLDRIAEFFADHAAHGPVAALGVASFGPLDLDPSSASYGHVTTTPKPGWAGADLVGGLVRRMAVSVALDTDVNGAALGEHRFGAARGLRSSAYVTVGTGIGGGAVVDGRPVRGLLHPEMGHLTVQRHPDDDFPGTCPFHGGCLEGLASGPAIQGRAGRPAQDLGPLRDQVVQMEAFYLAQLVAAALYLLSPQRIVLGGGVMHLDGLLDAVRAATAERLGGYVDARLLPPDLKAYLVRPGLGDDAGVVGAMALAETAAALTSTTTDPAPHPPGPEVHR